MEQLKSEATKELSMEETIRACRRMESLDDETLQDMIDLIEPDEMGYDGKEGIEDGTDDQ